MNGNDVLKLAPDELMHVSDDDLCRGYAVAMARNNHEYCRILEDEAVRRRAYGLFNYETWDGEYWLHNREGARNG